VDPKHARGEFDPMTIQASCPICSGKVVSLRHEWLFKCSRCGCLSSSLETNISANATETHIHEDVRKLGLDPIRARNNAVIFDRLSRLGVPGGKLLDVGCGHGQLLAAATKLGFTAVGIEPDGNVVERARNFSKAEVRQGYFPDPLRDGETFNAIVFNDVLEHIPDVRATVMACAQILEPGGVLVLNCPSKKGIFFVIANLLDVIGVRGPFDRLWQRELPSPHLWYFTPAHLQRLGELAGLKPALVETLLPIARTGMKERIFFVSNQSRILGYLTLIAVWCAYPVLNFLPRDIGVVFLRKER
jgi:SAM-dependent methyltransferase